MPPTSRSRDSNDISTRGRARRARPATPLRSARSSVQREKSRKRPPSPLSPRVLPKTRAASQARPTPTDHAGPWQARAAAVAAPLRHLGLVTPGSQPRQRIVERAR